MLKNQARKKKRTGSIKFCENMEDAIAAASATVEATAANRSSGDCGGYGGGGYRDGKRGFGGVTVEVDVDTGMEVVVVMDMKVVVDTEVDTFGNFVDETSFTNLIHTILFMELC
ncbi:hypothetical protein HID58_025684 [Brassica napus]|uniref:(rape) hypothetical protein n=1 Tax=Brassica napus TaxID=3708 RepID=A0A816K7M6_BRANA|nr:hypothetical protein HID58_025684 [Brassica napus]CAF1905115.1 unnamed protein product [Brassica napus]